MVTIGRQKQSKNERQNVNQAPVSYLHLSGQILSTIEAMSFLSPVFLCTLRRV